MYNNMLHKHTHENDAKPYTYPILKKANLQNGKIIDYIAKIAR